MYEVGFMESTSTLSKNILVLLTLVILGICVVQPGISSSTSSDRDQYPVDVFNGSFSFWHGPSQSQVLGTTVNISSVCPYAPCDGGW